MKRVLVIHVQVVYLVGHSTPLEGQLSFVDCGALSVFNVCFVTDVTPLFEEGVGVWAVGSDTVPCTSRDSSLVLQAIRVQE